MRYCYRRALDTRDYLYVLASDTLDPHVKAFASPKQSGWTVSLAALSKSVEGMEVCVRPTTNTAFAGSRIKRGKWRVNRAGFAGGSNS